LRFRWLLKSQKDTYKSLYIDQIQAGLGQCIVRYRLINYVWVKEEMLKHREESVIYKKVDKTDCSNYQGILFLSST